MPSLTLTLIGLALLASTAVGAALLLRSAGCSGWPILGGILAGLLLGPSVMGRVLPDLHERLFVGGVDDRIETQRIIRSLDADRIAAETAGAGPAALQRLAGEQADARAAATAVMERARWTYQLPMRVATVLLVALLAFAAPERRGERVPGRLPSAMSIGVWSSLLPGAVVFISMTRWWGHSTGAALIAGSAVAIGPWVLHGTDRDAAQRTEVGGATTIEDAGRVATVIAVASAIIGMWLLAAARDGLLVAGAALLAMLLRCALPQVSMGVSIDRARRLALPPLAALVTVRLDVLADAALWPIIVVLLLSGDGRWLGAVIGAIIPGGRRALHAMRLVLGSAAAGPMQLMITALAVWTWAIPAELALALLVGAAAMDASAPLRRSVSGWIVAAEREDPVDPTDPTAPQ